MSNRTIIDGSHGEGGGQVLRTSLSLAALLQRPLEIHSIRANRKKPGLRPQHLTAVKALAQITRADVSGDREASTSLLFSPHTIIGGKYHFNIGTAGSATLLATAILPPLLFADSKSNVIIEGGTHVPMSPVFQYMNEILFPFLRCMGAEVDATLDKWGWYPQGGGSCTIRVIPCSGLQALKIPKRGRLRDLTLLLGLTMGLPRHIIAREEGQMRDCLQKCGYQISSRFEPAPSPGEGNVLFLKGTYEKSLAGFSVLGKKGKPAERVAEELCRRWVQFERGNGSVDEYLADQILLYIALARGDSFLITEKISRHLLTNIEIIEKFLPVHFAVNPDVSSLEVTGAAYSAPQDGISDDTYP